MQSCQMLKGCECSLTQVSMGFAALQVSCLCNNVKKNKNKKKPSYIALQYVILKDTFGDIPCFYSQQIPNHTECIQLTNIVCAS